MRHKHQVCRDSFTRKSAVIGQKWCHIEKESRFKLIRCAFCSLFTKPASLLFVFEHQKQQSIIIDNRSIIFDCSLARPSNRKDDNNQIPRWAAINRTPHLVNRLNQMQTVYALLLLHATWSTTIITVTSSISVRSVLLTTPSFDTRSTAKRSDRIHRQFELEDTACTSEAANRVLFLTR